MQQEERDLIWLSVATLTVVLVLIYYAVVWCIFSDEGMDEKRALLKKTLLERKKKRNAPLHKVVDL